MMSRLVWQGTTTSNSVLDAKVQRYRKQTRQRIEHWKDQLLNQAFEKIDPADHGDLVQAMLEIGIEWKIAHLGAGIAEDLLNLDFRRLAVRDKLN
jgi:hypothetical protein